MPDISPILLMMSEKDQEYIPHFKPLLKSRKAYLITAEPANFAEIKHYADSKQIKYIITTQKSVLNKIVESQQDNSINDWNGSLYNRAGITSLFLNPLKQFFTVPYGKFLAERFVTKIVEPKSWARTPEFTWELANTETIARWYELFQKCIIIGEDIETVNYIDPNDNPYTIIRCVCYTGLWPDGKIHTIVLPIAEAPEELQQFFLHWMRKFDSLKVPKVFQNGLYDTGHLLTYGSPVSHYLWDTQSMFHSWQPELPKDLGFITAFCNHNVYYWKDMAKQGGTQLLFEYNARDGWGTILSWLYLITNMPEFAVRNYLLKFPIWPACCYCNLEGIKVNESTRQKYIDEYITTFKATRDRLGKWFGEGFNPGSWQQVQKLIHFYGSPDITSTDAPSLAKFGLRHPLNARFASEITESRETAKAISTYLKPKDFSVAITKSTKKQNPLLKNGRLFYALNPDGTDSTRLACRESIYWCGSQIQNQPIEMKGMYEADEGFELFELDNTTSESFCTGYVSGDINLLTTLLSGKDFHGINAERFFGIPYSEIVSIKDGVKKILNKKIRNLSKRTNHGATYDMQWFTLLATMGEKLVDEAKVLLKLPAYYNRRRVCEYLLECFDKAYPTIQHEWYDAVSEIVASTHMLVSALGWTRFCFGNPKKSKAEKDSYIAHVPQNLSVAIINEGFKRVFWEVQVPNSKNFRLKAQIHDSILGQARLGNRHLIEQARQICIRPTKVKDMVNGVERIMTIPVTKSVGRIWSDMEELAV